MADSESVDSSETPPALGANASAEGNTTAVGKFVTKKLIFLSFVHL